MLKILGDPSCDVLHTFSDDRKKRMKDVMVAAILATDMTRHFAIIEEFKSKKKFDPENLEDKKFVAGIMLHASDLNNPLLEMKYYLTWASTITQEFYNQFLAEGAKGYKQTAMLEYKGIKSFYGAQIFFSTKLVKPLFSVLDHRFKLNYCKDIERNVGELQKLIAEC